MNKKLIASNHKFTGGRFYGRTQSAAPSAGIILLLILVVSASVSPADRLEFKLSRQAEQIGVAALFYPLSSQQAENVARKITHYGKYSYLAFENGQNRAKGFWPATHSPLEYRWKDEGVK